MISAMLQNSGFEKKEEISWVRAGAAVHSSYSTVSSDLICKV